MAVYTRVERDELESFLRNYSLGAVRDFEGIAAGIENTNFWLTTDTGEYVLTLFERVASQEVRYFLDLMAYLADHGIPSAHPVADSTGQSLGNLHGLPTAICTRLPGAAVEAPAPVHCAAIGVALGRWHRVSMGFEGRRENPRGLRWWRELGEALQTQLPAAQAKLLDEELRFQSLFRLTDLPHGPIHADLFRDNALFVKDELSGLLDCYDACNGALLYDLAIAVNDWCSGADGSLDPERTAVLVSTYHRERPITAIERGAWPVMLRAAALRFWVSRLHDRHFPRPGALTQSKDPAVFEQILKKRIARREPLPIR